MGDACDESSSRSCEAASNADICDDKLALIGLDVGVTRSLCPLPIDVTLLLALLWLDVGVVDGVLVTFDMFLEKYPVSPIVCVGDASDGGGVGSGIEDIKDDMGVLGFGVLAGMLPLANNDGDGLGTGIIDAGLLPPPPLLSIGVDGITELFRLNDGDGDCDGPNCFASRICGSIFIFVSSWPPC